MNHPARDEALRRLLAAGDPLLPAERLSAADARRLRREVLAAAPRFERRRHLRTALAAAAVAAVATGLTLLRPAPPAPGGRPAASGPSEVAAVDAPQDRQIHLVTRGGTRVIWVLQADGD